jgi:hypothetical protein
MIKAIFLTKNSNIFGIPQVFIPLFIKTSSMGEMKINVYIKL